MKILVKIPSRGRPAELKARLKEFVNLSHLDTTYFIVVCDDDDKTMLWFEKEFTHPRVMFYYDPPSTKISVHNAHVSDEEWDILVAASDDMIPVEGYDKIIEEEMIKHFPYRNGALWFNTSDNDMTCTLTVIGRKLYDSFDYVYNPSYRSYYCDDEYSRILTKLGRLKRIERSVITHKVYQDNHPADATFLKSMVDSIHDMSLYKTRRASHFGMDNYGAVDSNLPPAFLRPRDNGTIWTTPMPKLEDRLDPLEVYVLEGMDISVLKMDTKEFSTFAKAFFRNNRMVIPKIIHQIWMGENMPDSIKEMVDTFRVDYLKAYHHMGWTHILWTDKKLAALPMMNRQLFDSEERMDCRSDIARLEILRQFGGWYVDSDCVWLGNKPLDMIGEESNGIIMAYEKKGDRIGKGYLDGETTRVANTIIGATVENPFLTYLTGRLVLSHKQNRINGVVASTGPDFIQSEIDSLKESGFEIKIKDCRMFYPVWWCNDPKKNPEHDRFLECLNLSGKEMLEKYPEAICFHKGHTAMVEGISP